MSKPAEEPLYPRGPLAAQRRNPSQQPRSTTSTTNRSRTKSTPAPSGPIPIRGNPKAIQRHRSPPSAAPPSRSTMPSDIHASRNAATFRSSPAAAPVFPPSSMSQPSANQPISLSASPSTVSNSDAIHAITSIDTPFDASTSPSQSLIDTVQSPQTIVKAIEPSAAAAQQNNVGHASAPIPPIAPTHSSYQVVDEFEESPTIEPTHEDPQSISLQQQSTKSPAINSNAATSRPLSQSPDVASATVEESVHPPTLLSPSSHPSRYAVPTSQAQVTTTQNPKLTKVSKRRAHIKRQRPSTLSKQKQTVPTFAKKQQIARSEEQTFSAAPLSPAPVIESDHSSSPMSQPKSNPSAEEQDALLRSSSHSLPAETQSPQAMSNASNPSPVTIDEKEVQSPSATVPRWRRWIQKIKNFRNPIPNWKTWPIIKHFSKQRPT